MTDSTKRSALKPSVRTALVVLCAAALFTVGWENRSIFTEHAEAHTITSTTSQMSGTLQSETVDVIGGSMAHGWLDAHENSYIRRAFRERSNSTNVTYRYIDHTRPGLTGHMLDQEHPRPFGLWMHRDHPDVVVIAWGLLNDMSSQHKTTVGLFSRTLHSEIAAALASHAVVLIVTPPVTEQSAVTDHAKQEVYLKHQAQVVQSFHSPNIYTFDVYHQMELYMKAHHQTFRRYYGNSWHPNTAGHVLSGQLLANDFVRQFGCGPIQWIPQS